MRLGRERAAYAACIGVALLAVAGMSMGSWKTTSPFQLFIETSHLMNMKVRLFALPRAFPRLRIRMHRTQSPNPHSPRATCPRENAKSSLKIAQAKETEERERTKRI
ncbi:hypothetical protein ACHAWF_009799 [Thalassiosira exigua]